MRKFALVLIVAFLPGCSALQGLLGGGDSKPSSAPADGAAPKLSTPQSVTYSFTSSSGLQVDATLTIHAASAPAK